MVEFTKEDRVKMALTVDPMIDVLGTHCSVSEEILDGHLAAGALAMTLATLISAAPLHERNTIKMAFAQIFHYAEAKVAEPQ